MTDEILNKYIDTAIEKGKTTKCDLNGLGVVVEKIGNCDGAFSEVGYGQAVVSRQFYPSVSVVMVRTEYAETVTFRYEAEFNAKGVLAFAFYDENMNVIHTDRREISRGTEDIEIKSDVDAKYIAIILATASTTNNTAKSALYNITTKKLPPPEPPEEVSKPLLAVLGSLVIIGIALALRR